MYVEEIHFEIVT